MPNHPDTALAIYWDLDQPPAALVPPGRSADPVACTLARAHAFGHPVVQRALGAGAAGASRLGAQLQRQGVEPILLAPTRFWAPESTGGAWAGWIDCIAQDLMRHPGVGGVVLVSGRGSLAPVQAFVARTGRRCVVLGDDAPALPRTSALSALQRTSARSAVQGACAA